MKKLRGLKKDIARIKTIERERELHLHGEEHKEESATETREAAANAYRQAGISAPREQLDVVECHDCFTITELINYEDLGLCDRGEGASLLRSGATTRGGDMPVNLSGGLQACGHPVGATGVRMIKEISDQVLGRAGERAPALDDAVALDDGRRDRPAEPP